MAQTMICHIITVKKQATETPTQDHTTIVKKNEPEI